MWLYVKPMIYHFYYVLRRITFHGVFNYLKLVISFYISRFFKRPILLGFPWALSIEPSGVCNLACPECALGVGALLRKGGMMSVNTYSKILNDAGKQLRYINLFFQGEPLMNKNIAEMIRMANANKLYTSLSTNAHFMKPDLCVDLIKSGLSKIIISLDGFSQEVYSKYRVGGDLELVKRAIVEFVDTRNSLNMTFPIVEVQMLAFKHNQHQFEDVHQWCKSVGVDKFVIKSAQINDFGFSDMEPSLIKNYSRYKRLNNGTYLLKGKIYNHCFKQWSSSVISWDGGVATCCYDKDLIFSPGNIKENSLKEIWQSNSLNIFRKTILNQKCDIKMCCNCNEGRSFLI